MEVRFTPRMVIDHYLTRRQLEMGDLGISPIVVVSWGRRVIETFAKNLGAEISPHWLYSDRYPLYYGDINGYPVSFAHLPIGAPGTVMMIEEMIACGTHTIIGLGWAGSLQPSLPIGSFIIPTSCISEEGTSPHYYENPHQFQPSLDLVEKLKLAADNQGEIVQDGPLWTTDAPFRESDIKINDYRKKGVLGVDMETSAMYTLGQYRSVKIANLLVISDELWEEWAPAFGTPELIEATMRAVALVQETLFLLID